MMGLVMMDWLVMGFMEAGILLLVLAFGVLMLRCLMSICRLWGMFLLDLMLVVN